MTPVSLTEPKVAAAASPQPRALGAKHIARILDLTGGEIRSIITLAERLRTQGYAPWSHTMSGRAMALVFEKASLRTRVSFEVGFQRLGGSVIYLDQQNNPLGVRETLADFGHNMERFVDCLVARVMKHSVIEGLCDSMRVPVINALCDRHHPCQALADFQTLLALESDSTHIHLAWVGDGNNVCHSLMECAAALGSRITVVTPKGLEPDAAITAQAQGRAMRTGATITLSNAIDAIAGATAVYADVWVSMGEADGDAKRLALEPYRIDDRLMAIAGPQARFMHCLPAKRGQEVTDSVMDSPASIVFDQAENRMHAQASLLLHLLAPTATH